MEPYRRIEGFCGAEVDETFFDLVLQVKRGWHFFVLGVLQIGFFLGFVFLTYTFSIIMLLIRTINE